MLEQLSAWHREERSLAAVLLSGRQMSREARREFERRHTYCAGQVDRFERKWSSHLSRNIGHPAVTAWLVEKKRCMLTAPVLHDSYDDGEQNGGVRAVLGGSSRDGA